ncbi:zinc-binding alcohol dehydrogenase family protein [Aestuariivirga sp.]|uniref:zinc-binding alcohol dehydrogenase family protein n=1 Tax=Aestuariivirga sp. TaxID=2650926 RepID=UPI003783DE15
MKAVGYRNAGPVSDSQALEDITLPVPVPTGRDIRVAVRAVSVNPVDTKIRRGVAPPPGEHKVVGWDAAGVVDAVGPEATLFKPGDEVFYAGSLDRPGTNSALHIVDERIVGRKPRNLNFAEAAALPLTAITAWEALFDRLKVTVPTPEGAGSILVVGGAGGVGSIAIQILRQLTGLTIIATASRPETQAWVKEMGAHHVVDHRKPLNEEVKRLGLSAPGFVFSTTETDKHLDAIVDLMAPQGRFCLIDDPPPLDIMKLKRKSLSLHWELMFTRPLYGTADIEEQHRLLNSVSAMVEEGKIRTTMSAHFGAITAANLLKAHALIESGSARGKIVLEGF